MKHDIEKLRKSLKSKLPTARYEHTLSVSFTAVALAMRYEYSLEKAELAGLLHDCAKGFDDATIIQKCQKKKVPLTKEERNAPAVIHAKLGAVLAKDKYGVEDEEILDAIRYHTTGREDMTLLDKIIYVADYIEPRRNKAPHLEELRKLAFIDLDEAMFQIMHNTLKYLESKGGSIDPMSENAYRYYKKKRESSSEAFEVSVL